jgi:hypothetical protein
MDGGNRSIIMSFEWKSRPVSLTLDVKSKYIVFFYSNVHVNVHPIFYIYEYLSI